MFVAFPSKKVFSPLQYRPDFFYSHVCVQSKRAYSLPHSLSVGVACVATVSVMVMQLTTKPSEANTGSKHAIKSRLSTISAVVSARGPGGPKMAAI